MTKFPPRLPLGPAGVVFVIMSAYTIVNGAVTILAFYQVCIIIMRTKILNFNIIQYQPQALDQPRSKVVF